MSTIPDLGLIKGEQLLSPPLAYLLLFGWLIGCDRTADWRESNDVAFFWLLRRNGILVLLLASSLFVAFAIALRLPGFPFRPPPVAISAHQPVERKLIGLIPPPSLSGISLSIFCYLFSSSSCFDARARFHGWAERNFNKLLPPSEAICCLPPPSWSAFSAHAHKLASRLGRLTSSGQADKAAGISPAPAFSLPPKCAAHFGASWLIKVPS
jgi:hypothetical protein